MEGIVGRSAGPPAHLAMKLGIQGSILGLTLCRVAEPCVELEELGQRPPGKIAGRHAVHREKDQGRRRWLPRSHCAGPNPGGGESRREPAIRSLETRSWAAKAVSREWVSAM